MSTLQGRIALVTGATSGIGYETALGLARAGLRVGLVGRAQGRARASAEAIRQAVPGAEIDVFVADLSAQSEIRRLAGAVREAYPRLDVLVNNAGAIFDRRETTVDGIERTWALDHLGYVLLTLDLLDLLKATAREAGEARIVNVASAAHARGRIDVDDLEGRRAYGAIKAYSQAKLGNVLFTYALARRLDGTGVTANALHPGVVNTGFARNTGGVLGFAWSLIRPFLIAPKSGAETSLHAATAPELRGVSGRYLAKARIAESSASSRDRALQERVWALSLRQVGREG